MTNQEFLHQVFGEAWPEVRVCLFEGDPADQKGWRDVAAGTASLDHDDLNAYYTVSTFDGSRRKKDFKAWHVLVIDDVGDGPSAKIPFAKVNRIFGDKRVYPTFVIETSPGNQQLGYVLAEPCTSRAKAEAIIGAVIDALGEDPGMSSVSRFVRLPNAVNGKTKYQVEGRPFRCRLTHADWHLRPVIEQLADALNVDLDLVVDTEQSYAQIDASRDRFLIALANAGQVKADLGDGRYDMTCPWVEDHTEAQDDGAAYLSPEGFKCHHGSCKDRTFRDLREWLAAEHPSAMSAATHQVVLDVAGLEPSAEPAPAPAAEPAATFQGLVDDLDRKLAPLGELCAAVRRDKAPGEQPDALIEVWRAAREAYESWLADHFTYLGGSDEWICPGVSSRKLPAMEQGTKPPLERAAGVIRWNLAELGDKRSKDIKPGPFRHHWKRSGGAQAEITAWWPDPQVRFCATEHGLGLNTYHRVGVAAEAATAEDVQLWLDHVAWLVPDQDQREHLLDWLAFMLQSPTQKAHHGILLGGAHRVGKDMLFRPIARYWGSCCNEVSEAELMGGFDDELIGKKFVIVTEAMDLHGKRAENHLKKLLAGTASEKMTLNPKYRPKIEVPNLWAFALLTNFRDAVSLTAGNDRLFCIWAQPSTAEANARASEGYFDKLSAWYEAGGNGKVAGYLLQRQVRRPATRPAPSTPWRDRIATDSRDAYEAVLEDAIVGFEGVFARDVVQHSEVEQFLTVMKQMKNLRRKIRAKMEAVGAVWREAFRRGEDGKTVRYNLYILRNHERYATMSGSQLIDQLEAT